jgi:hypothetical protein
MILLVCSGFWFWGFILSGGDIRFASGKGRSGDGLGQACGERYLTDFWGGHPGLRAAGLGGTCLISFGGAPLTYSEKNEMLLKSFGPSGA